MPGVTGKQAQETDRFAEILRSVGYALSGRAGERLSVRLGLRISDDTLLRRVKEAAKDAPPLQAIRAIGVDDWAWSKGKNFGSIVVDLERGTAVDVLPLRSAKALSEWLERHPGVSVVARDRQGLYAEGARRGAPDAVQVADRFHLIQNLRQAVERALAVQRSHLRVPARVQDVLIPRSLPVRKGHRILVRSRVAQMEAETVRQRRQERLKLFQTVKEMQAAGLRISEIARHLGVNRRRLDKWARLDTLPERDRMQPRPGMAESFRDYLRRRWEQGCRHGRTLLAEIRQLGYIGGHSQLAKLLSPWRQPPTDTNPAAEHMTEERSISIPGRSIAPQVAAALLSKIPSELTDHQAEIVSTLKKQCPGFAAMRKLVLSFRSILRRGKVGTLKRCIKEGGKCRDHCDHQICQALKERSGGRGECGGVWLEQRSCRRTYQPLESCEEANVRKSGIRAASITSSPLGGLNEPAPNLRKNPLIVDKVFPKVSPRIIKGRPFLE